ncbi:kinase-like protein [Backusella circina FSU 941]|nr:kinase-like protein [Backusella circina FSU 941]
MIDPNTFLHKRIDNNTVHLIKILGSGSHGVVYLGRHKGKYYAVKCVADNGMSDNEIHMHSILSGHKNILSLEKVIKEKKHFFIIMQYATHGDLFDYMRKKSYYDTRSLYLQILDAVHHCHYNFIAHRDLKPENILMMSNQQVKLADFGLSTIDPTSTQYYHGTSSYFSPEHSTTKTNTAISKILQGYDTFANDIWSLGVILVVLVFGRHPWLRANLKDPAFANYVRQPDTFFQQTFPSISKKFNALLQRIFCLDPEKRITLTELRAKVSKCHFVSHITALPLPPLPIESIGERTLLEYTEFFTDDDDDSEESDDDEVSTPANASPVLNIKQIV